MPECDPKQPAPVALAEVCARHGAAFLRRHGARLSPAMWRAWRAITACRTAALGAQVYRCKGCGKGHCAYHSCRHRLCPKCGGCEAAGLQIGKSQHILTGHLKLGNHRLAQNDRVQRQYRQIAVIIKRHRIEMPRQYNRSGTSSTFQNEYVAAA